MVAPINENHNHPFLPGRGLGSEHMVQILSYTRRPKNMWDWNQEKQNARIITKSPTRHNYSPNVSRISVMRTNLLG